MTTELVAPVGGVQHTATQSTTPDAPRKHARCSPSKLKNLEICPSYQGDNDSTPHPITLRGTAMHEALETGDDSKLLTEDLQSGLPSTEEHDLVTAVRDYINAEKEAYGIVEVLDEQHLKTHDPDVKGFADRIMVGPIKANGKRTIYIRDYKMGFNLVDLPNVNPQAIAYTVAAFLRWADADEVHFAFMIPRVDAVLEHTFRREDLPMLQLRLSTIADRVRQFAGQHFNPVDENCLYCGRKASCTALHQKALTIANAYNDDEKLVLPTEFHSSQITDPVQMGRALNVATVMEKWCDSVRSHALKLRLEVGLEIPGYQLIERKGKRTVINVQQAYDTAAEYGITHPEFMAAADISLPALEKLVSAKTETGKAKRAQEFVDKLRDADAVSAGNPFFVLQKERKKKTITPAAA